MDNQIAKVEKLTNKNALVIESILEAIKNTNANVKELTSTVKEEDKELKKAVDRLIKAQTECKYEMQGLNRALESKREIINTLNALIDKKANVEDVHQLKSFIHKSLWWLFGGMVAVIGFLLQQTIFKG